MHYVDHDTSRGAYGGRTQINFDGTEVVKGEKQTNKQTNNNNNKTKNLADRKLRSLNLRMGWYLLQAKRDSILSARCGAVCKITDNIGTSI